MRRSTDQRIRQPLVRTSSGVQQPVSWHEALRTLKARLAEAPSDETGAKAGLLFLASAHASLAFTEPRETGSQSSFSTAA